MLTHREITAKGCAGGKMSDPNWGNAKLTIINDHTLKYSFSVPNSTFLSDLAFYRSNPGYVASHYMKDFHILFLLLYISGRTISEVVNISYANYYFSAIFFFGRQKCCPRSETGLNFITSSLIIGGGYGKRDIKGELDRELTQVGVFKVTDSEELLMTRVGFEAALWNKDNFLMKGSLYYSHMSPLDDRNDAFGGIGWSFGFFPIWSEIR